MSEPKRESPEDPYQILEKLETEQQAAALDPRYGFDPEFTSQAKARKTFTMNLRKQLRDAADISLARGNTDMNVFLQNLGLQEDQIKELRETGSVVETFASTIEKAAKFISPLI